MHLCILMLYNLLPSSHVVYHPIQLENSHMAGGKLLVRNLGAFEVVMSRSVKIPSNLMIQDWVHVYVGAVPA